MIRVGRRVSRFLGRMRESKSVPIKTQVTIARLMGAVAVFGVALTILRYVPLAFVCVGPPAGSLRGIRRGEKGFIGGLLTGWAIGVLHLAGTWFLFGLGSRSVTELMDATCTGAVIGTSVGTVSWFAITLVRISTDVGRAAGVYRFRARRSRQGGLTSTSASSAIAPSLARGQGATLEEQIHGSHVGSRGMTGPPEPRDKR